MPFRPLEEIIEEYRARREAMGPLLGKARVVRDTYNGEWAIPIKELSAEARSYVPNLLQQGVDQTSRRIAQVPQIECPPSRAGTRAEKEARERRRAFLGLWEENHVDFMLRRRARQLIAYAASPVVIRPDRSRNAARWYARDPLNTFPAPTTDPDDPEVPDCIFAFRRDRRWLARNYPAALAQLRHSGERGARATDGVIVVEYVDGDEFTQFVYTEGDDPQFGDVWPTGSSSFDPSNRYVVLERWENRSGLCPAVVAGRVTLDQRTGQFDGMVGMHQTQAMLFALELEAVIEGVWPNEWLVGTMPGQEPKVIQEPDGRRGIYGILQDGRLEKIDKAPGYMTNPTRDYLERNQRVDAGIPPDFGGESGSNIRTGRRGENLLSAVVDFNVAEAQAVLARSLQAENDRAGAISRAYFGNVSRTFHISWDRVPGAMTYQASKTFESTQNRVFYPMLGTDLNNQTIMLGQLLGTGLLSTRTAMELHPFIADAESEHDRIVAESLERAGLDSIAQMVAAGQIPPADWARIAELVRSDRKELWEAVLVAQREAQERQSADNAVAPGAPEAQPGIALPGTGAEAPTAIPEVPASLEALAAQFGALYPGSAELRRTA